MIEGIFIEIGLITLVTLVVTGIMTALRQPIIIGYILSGILLGPYFLNITQSEGAIGTFAKMGVVFLLFLVGLGLNPKIIKEVGKVSLVTGLGQVLFTSLVGFFIASNLLKFSVTESLYIAVALTFSSTIIIMKIISDKEDTESVYGRIAIGFLIVQDIVAMLLLLVTSAFAGSSESIGETSLIILIKLILSGSILVLIGHFVLPRIMKLAARSQEYLLLSSIGWVLIVAVVFHALEFSMEIGALLAGITLANSPYRFEITSKLKPLRDFFVFMFFVLLGSQMVFTSIGQSVVPIVVFSLFILIGNPLIVMITMGALGYTKKSSFFAGLTVAQISEFSLIYIALGITVGHIGKDILPLVTIIGLITIAGSTYMMIYSEKIYSVISKYLTIFEKKGKKVDEYKFHEGNEFDAILFGYHRMGRSIKQSLEKLGVSHLVVDYNPEVIKKLSEEGAECRYGDAGDAELLNELNLCKAKIIISTVKDFDTNALVIERVREKNKKVIIITVSNQAEEALELYERGSSYVILPQQLGGYHASMMIEEYQFDIKKFMNEKTFHQKQLKEASSK
jgi:Kef-type K+ transport system membrane component KefB